jgi:hypothetical protein
MKKAKKTVKDVGWGPMIATHGEPPAKRKPKLSHFCPEMAQRMLRALRDLFNGKRLSNAPVR